MPQSSFLPEIITNQPELEIELETGNEEVVIKVPFDPNKIKVNTRPYTLGQILDDLRDHIIDLDTEFQRLPGLWDAKKKSRFIESLLLKLPIPAFYFNEKEENKWEVVDGLQRVSTLKSFVMDSDLTLEDLEFLKEFNGINFANLPPTLQRRIRTFPITLYLIEKGTPDEVKYNIFKRINQGGLILTPQEIRHAINQGKPSDLVADLVRAKDSLDNGGIKKRQSNGTIVELKATTEGLSFVKATDGRISSIRMEDRDFATRFVAFYLIPYQEYEPDLDTFLNKGMVKIKDLSNNQTLKLKKDFKKAMDIAFKIFGNNAFRKIFNVTDNRKPINKALFEVISVNFAKLSDEDAKRIIERKKIFQNKLIDLHNDPDGKFLRSISQGTARKDTVEQRFKDIEKIIKDTITND